METFIIPQYKFLEMAGKFAAKEIAENSRITQITHYMGKEYVNTGGWHDSNVIKEGSYIDAYRVIDEVYWKGIKPLDYQAHFEQVLLGFRERGYISIKIRFKKRSLVCVEKVRFEPMMEEQLSIF